MLCFYLSFSNKLKIIIWWPKREHSKDHITRNKILCHWNSDEEWNVFHQPQQQLFLHHTKKKYIYEINPRASKWKIPHRNISFFFIYKFKTHKFNCKYKWLLYVYWNANSMSYDIFMIVDINVPNNFNLYIKTQD